MKSATAVKQASDAVLLQYEKPRDQSAVVQNKRAAYGHTFYDKYAGNAPAQTSAVPYRVKVSIPDLNIRKGPGTTYSKTGKCTGVGVFTIVEEQSGWGKLKSGAGWICLSYATRM